MKQTIKVYIVTYKRNDVLNENLASLWENTANPNDIDLTILSNHPDIVIDEANKRDNMKVVINTTRMPHAWGYLSRDWNFCILDCFRTWDNPNNVDWCVLAQNDVTWAADWDIWLKNNKKFDFVSNPPGDQAIALNIEVVKKIGFFDERFTTLHFQEADYFLRAINALGERCSIYDGHKYANGKSLLDFQSSGNVLINKIYNDFVNDEMHHNSKNFKASLNYVLTKYKGLKLHGSKLKDLLSVKRDKEINWYPFFWDGYDDINKTFLEEHRESNYEKINRKIKAILVPFIPSKVKSLIKKILKK